MHLWIAWSQTSMGTFWSLLKENPDQSELCVLSRVFWDKGWPKVDSFILGVLYSSAPVGRKCGNGYQRGLTFDQRDIPSD